MTEQSNELSKQALQGAVFECLKTACIITSTRPEVGNAVAVWYNSEGQVSEELDEITLDLCMELYPKLFGV